MALGSLATSSDCATTRSGWPSIGLDLVADRGHRALDEGDEPRRALTSISRPLGERQWTWRVSVAGAQVERARVVEQLAVADVERLVVDQQPDDLAVGDVDDGLAVLRVAVAGLGVRQRAGLVEAVQVGAGEPERLALVEVAAQPDVAVGEREDRLRLGEHVELQAVLGDRPRLDAERRMRRSQQLGEVVDDDVGAVLEQRLALVRAVDADHVPEVPRAARRDAGLRVLEHRGLRPARRRAASPPSRNVSGAGLPRRPSSSLTWPSTRSSKKRSRPVASRTSRGVVARGDQRAAQAGVSRRLQVAARAR